MYFSQCSVSYDLPIDKYEKSELCYKEGNFEVTCYTRKIYDTCISIYLFILIFQTGKAD